MNSSPVLFTPSIPAARGLRLSARTSFYLQASIILFFLAGSSAPTPLYALYQARWGFSPIAITVIFGVYAIAVLSALLTAGSLSDYVGRRPVLLVATLAQAGTMLLFTRANGLESLFVARIIQGVATGFAASAVGAGMLDIDRDKGTIANAVGPMLGTAVGALGSGLFVQYLPAPTELVYLVLFGVFVLQALGVVFMPESVTPRAGALASLKPRFRAPLAVRKPLLLVVPAAVAAWALAGFYGALGPMLLRQMVGFRSPVLGGLALFTLAAGGVVTVLILHRRPARSMLGFGAAALFAGVGVTLVAIAHASLTGFFIGTTIAGMGFGASFQGAIRTVMPLAAAHERAGVLSVMYVVAYVAFGLPAVIAGFGVVYGGGVLATARVYGVAVMALSVLALVGVAIHRPKTGLPPSRSNQEAT
ncbi:MAG TPA: MFS transporter [Polyangiaceae bacterium]|nr:MFS transporter [Polyangiaceae bacterium]